MLLCLTQRIKRISVLLFLALVTLSVLTADDCAFRLVIIPAINIARVKT